MEISLEQLKADNAAEELATKGTEVIEPKEVVKDEYVEVKEEAEAVKEDVKPVEDDDGETKPIIESWMQTEDAETSEDDQNSGFVPNHEAAKRRKKNQALKGEIKEKDDENAKLLKRISDLEAGNATQAAPQDKAELPVRPTREQFNFDDDAYDEAVDKWNDDRFDIKLNQNFQANHDKNQQAQQQKASQDLITKNVETHYENAQKLVDGGLITAESFKNSDSAFRRTLDGLYPGQGDFVANDMIAKLNTLGEGSEKVTYQLTVNSAKMQKFVQLIENDKSGATAIGYLSILQSQIQTPNKRSSQAPAPGTKVEGESGNGGKAGTMQKEYAKSDDLQTRITLKRKAKSQGVDVSNW